MKRNVLKNNKGFTIVELLAVIVILAIIISIAVPSALSISAKVKSRMYNSKVDMILSGARLYGQDNSDKVNTDGSCGKTVTIATLLDAGYVKSDEGGEKIINDPRNGNSLTGKSICIKKANNRIKAEKYGTW